MHKLAMERGRSKEDVCRADNLAGGPVQLLQSRGVGFRTLSDLHAKLLLTDATAMNGSANFTDATAHRASEPVAAG